MPRPRDEEAGGGGGVGADGAPGDTAPHPPSPFATLLADGDATAAVLGFLRCADLAQLRAASRALRDAVAGCAFAGGLTMGTAKGTRRLDFAKWRPCFPGAVHLRIEDFGGLRDADLVAVGGIVRKVIIVQRDNACPPLTDAGFRCLTGLQELGMPAGGVSITPACFPAFATSLTSLKCLSYDGSLNVFRDLSAFTALQSLRADFIPTPSPASLRTCKLEFRVDVRLDDAVTRTLGGVEDLSIVAHSATMFSSSIFRPLRRVRQLSVFVVASDIVPSELAPSDFAALAAAGIQSLMVQGASATLPDACLAQLGASLKELDTDAACTDEGLSHLTGLETLRLGHSVYWHILTQYESVTGAFLRHMPRLRRLDFYGGAALTDAALQSVKGGLVDISLRSCNSVTAAAFSGMASLETLDLEDCKGVKLTALPLVQLPALRRVRVLEIGQLTKDAAFARKLARLGFELGGDWWWERARGPGG